MWLQFVDKADETADGQTVFINWMAIMETNHSGCLLIMNIIYSIKQLNLRKFIWDI